MKENKENRKREEELGWEMKRSGRSSPRVRDKKGWNDKSRPRRTHTQNIHPRSFKSRQARQGKAARERRVKEGWTARWRMDD